MRFRYIRGNKRKGKRKERRVLLLLCLIYRTGKDGFLDMHARVYAGARTAWHGVGWWERGSEVIHGLVSTVRVVQYRHHIFIVTYPWAGTWYIQNTHTARAGYNNQSHQGITSHSQSGEQGNIEISKAHKSSLI